MEELFSCLYKGYKLVKLCRVNILFFIYRDEVYNPDTDKKNIAEIIIAKQRSGPIETVELAWLPEYMQYANLKR
ncbi:MAG: hypothetical protein J6N53_16270 [Lachnospiraceae bacterium]|nr:hypothetical protein [Lachnospiraceae bacterium]